MANPRWTLTMRALDNMDTDSDARAEVTMEFGTDDDAAEVGEAAGNVARQFHHLMAEFKTLAGEAGEEDE